MDSVFSQLSVMGSSLVLIFGLILLWRRGVTAYISAFTWQSAVLSVVTVVVAYFGHDHELYWVAVALFLLKAVVIPRLLRRMERRFAAERELEPYVNTATSLVISGLLVLFGYAITRPLVALSQLPTRAGMPLAMGLVLVSLFVIVSRKKALLAAAVKPYRSFVGWTNALLSLVSLGAAVVLWRHILAGEVLTSGPGEF